MSNIHEYFNRASEEWDIRDFLEECDLEPFERKTDSYVKSLQAIANNKRDNRKNKAQQLLDSFKKKANCNGSDRQVAKSWNNERSHNRIYLHKPTITGENINGFINMNKNGTFVSGSSISKRDYEGDEHKDRTKKMKIDTKIDNFFSPVIHSSQYDQAHKNVNNNRDNEEHAFSLDSQGYRDDFSEEELEDSLLQETPDAIVDCKLIINNLCIRSAMEKWRKSSKYVEEIHKQDLMRYNIIDTTVSSATEAQKLFKEQWDDIINTIEGLLTSSSNATPLALASASTSAPSNQDTVQDGQAEEVKQYVKVILTNANSAKKLREVIKMERAKLRTDGNIKWKRRALRLMKIFRDQFPNNENYFKDNQTEYDYIIRFISRVYTILFKDKKFLKQSWGEKTLRSSAILLNQSLKDDDRRCSGNKIDAIISMVDLDLEISTLEVSGSPSCLDHTHYVGDKNKIAKMLKIILNFIKINYSGCYEDFRRIKVYGIQVYDHTFYIYSMCLPFAGIYYFKLEKKFSCPTMTFLLFKELPKFTSNLWMMRDIIISSTERILTYITNTISESSDDDDSKIDKVKTSPGKKKNNRTKTSE